MLFFFLKQKQYVYIFSVFEMQINLAFFHLIIMELTPYQHIELLLCF